jgi:hypothetical protein
MSEPQRSVRTVGIVVHVPMEFPDIKELRNLYVHLSRVAMWVRLTRSMKKREKERENVQDDAREAVSMQVQSRLPLLPRCNVTLCIVIMFQCGYLGSFTCDEAARRVDLGLSDMRQQFKL